MSNEQSYLEQVAPYPSSEDPDVADKLARYLAGLVQSDIARAGDHHYLRSDRGSVDYRRAAREYGLLVGRLVGHYGVLALLRRMINIAPAEADVAARALVEDWNAGDPIGEWTWECWSSRPGLGSSSWTG